MKKSQLKQIIKECLKEALANSPFYKTLGEALSAVEEFVQENHIVLDDKEHPKDAADVYGVRGPFLFGGITYEQNRDAHFKLISYKNKPTKKYLHVIIYRMPSGSYELTKYVS
jgi:hypothetical protein